jgi:hypothetical protein
MIECFKRGLFIQGLLHDISKLLPCEFFPYLNWFYNKNNYHKRSDLFGDIRNVITYCQEDLKEDFDKAWLHHIHCNPHHWQYWILQYDNGRAECLEMPRNYIKEMIADWIGAGIAITGKNDVLGWYDKNKDNMKLHPETRFLVEYYLGI